MKKIIALSIILTTLLSGCNLCRYASKRCPQTSAETFKDSTFNKSTQKETIYIVDTLVLRELQPEFVRDFSGLTDTLTRSTSYSIATTYIDTNNKLLILFIHNKDSAKIPVRIEYREVIKTDTVHKYIDRDKKTISYSKPSGFSVFLQWSGGILWIVIIIIVIALIIRWYVKSKTGK